MKAVIILLPLFLIVIVLYLFLQCQWNRNNRRQYPFFSRPFNPWISPTARGKIGEDAVQRVLGSNIPEEKYVINNLILKTYNSSSQIDHVLILPSGIYVIETKNYSGRIYGSEEQKEWTQVLSYGRVRNRFYNPLMQNQTHITNVAKIVGKDIPIFSVVVFVQGNIENIVSNHVYTLSELHQLIHNPSQTKLSKDQMIRCYGKLLKAQITEQITEEEHVENVLKQQQKIKDGICPRCNGQLVLRTHNGSDFWGCSNYPKCRFVINKR